MLVTREAFPGGVSLLRAPVDVLSAQKTVEGGTRMFGLESSHLHAHLQTTVLRDVKSEVLTLQATDNEGSFSGPAYRADRDELESAYGTHPALECIVFRLKHATKRPHRLPPPPFSSS